MRPLHAMLLMAPLAGAVGCTLFSKNSDPPHPTTPVPEYAADRFVRYLNDRAARLKTISAKVQLSGRSEGLPFNLSGNLAVAQPKYFRMRGDGTLAGEFDLGSNMDQFWMYMKAPATKPMYVYASHKDFEDGRAQLPPGIAFEPDWVMQALGMHLFPTSDRQRYNEPQIDQKDRTYTLSWQANTPAGPVRKEVVFEADDTRGDRPQVKKHVIRDSRNRILCTAVVKSAATLPGGQADPRVPQASPMPIQYPTHVALHWEMQKFDLDIRLSDVKVNSHFSDEQFGHFFTRPTMNVEAVNLADYRFSSAGR